MSLAVINALRATRGAVRPTIRGPKPSRKDTAISLYSRRCFPQSSGDSLRARSVKQESWGSEKNLFVLFGSDLFPGYRRYSTITGQTTSEEFERDCLHDMIRKRNEGNLSSISVSQLTSLLNGSDDSQLVKIIFSMYENLERCIDVYYFSLLRHLCRMTQVHSQAEEELLVETLKKFIQQLPSSRIDLNAKLTDSELEIGGCGGLTPLDKAAREGLTPLCQALVAVGAKIDGTSEYQYTPLMRAAMFGHLDTCKVLVKLGADVNKNIDGITPLTKGCYYPEIISFLVAEGADMNEEGGSLDHPPLTHAVDGVRDLSIDDKENKLPVLRRRVDAVETFCALGATVKKEDIFKLEDKIIELFLDSHCMDAEIRKGYDQSDEPFEVNFTQCAVDEYIRALTALYKAINKEEERVSEKLKSEKPGCCVIQRDFFEKDYHASWFAIKVKLGFPDRETYFVLRGRNTWIASK